MNIYVLLDPLTKSTVQQINTDSISIKCSIIEDVREITDPSSVLVFFEPAVDVIITREILEHLKISRCFLIYSDDEAVTTMPNMVSCVKCNYSIVDYNLIYSAVNADTAIQEKYAKNKEIKAYRKFEEKLPADLVEYGRHLRNSLLSTSIKLRKAEEELATLNRDLSVRKIVGDRCVEAVRELKSLLDKAGDKISAYELLLSKCYSDTFRGFFPDKPKILVIKSISHVAGIDVLINTLYTVFTKQYKCSCKVVKFLDSSNSRDIRYTPNIYTKLSDVYTLEDVLSSDFLLKLGDITNLLDILMMNRSGLNYLIIHDMRSVLKPCIDTELVNLYLNEMTADFAAVGEYSNILTDISSTADFVWNYSDCIKYSGSRSAKLVNHPTVSKIVSQVI